PPPTISWFYAGKPLENTNDCKIENEDYKSNIQLKNKTRAQSDEAEVQINVLDKPDKSEGPLEVSDVRKDGCKLKWKAPDDDGGSPSEGYEIEKLDEETGKCVSCGKSTDPFFEMKNLTPDHKYKFRVRAVNKDGESDELETDRAIVAKNPFDTPDAPGQPKATDWDPTFAQLEWTPPLAEGGRPVTEKHEFRVSAINEGGVGKSSKASAPVTVEERKFALDAPDMPKPEKITKDSVTLSWKKPSNDGGSKIIGYVILSRTNTVTGLKEGEEYEFRVAVNEIGENPPSKACPLVQVEK
ncbi:twitchin-like protein, partial [Dinothrombium tinctorium]